MRFSNKAGTNHYQSELDKIVEILRKISCGDFNINENISGIFAVTTDENDPFFRANQYLLKIKNTFESIADDTEDVLENIKSGNLNHWIDTVKYNGLYSRIGESLNASVKSISEPITEADGILKKMAENDFTAKMSGDYRGDFASIAVSINDVQNRLLSAQNVAEKISKGDISELENFRKIGRRSENDHLIPAFISMMETIRELIGEITEISDAAAEGRLDVRGKCVNFKGEYVNIITGINKILDAISVPLSGAEDMIKRMCANDFTEEMSKEFKGQYLELSNSMNTLMSRLVGLQNVFISLANGDTSRVEDYRKIGKRSENDKIMPATIAMMDTVRAIIKETERLTFEAVKGNIRNARGDAGRFEGGFKEIVSGMNGMLDAVSKPMEETLGILTKMANNDFTENMSSNYNGDFALLSGALNDVQRRLLSAQNVAEKISRGDTSELEDFRKIGKRSENDHLVPAFAGMMETIRELIDETNRISSSAIEGKLNVRGDENKFKGDYVSIIAGINATLDAVVTPINEVSDVILKMSEGSISVSIKGQYKGEYEILAGSVNTLITNLGSVIKEVSNVLSRIAQGDLNIDDIRSFKGDYASISDSLKTIIKSLNLTLGNINTAAEQVAAGAVQISESSQSLSQGSEEQASSIEEITASITELATQVKANATNASQANGISLNTKENAAKGNHQMEEMLQAMKDINESSSNISKIIKVIDDIASQTNILALNAAVEAARAGQYGKGFAVVAEEVRNLAAKSANAAKETTALIDGSIEKVSSGSMTANETAQSLKEIVGSITEAADLISQIATASNEQADAISQINQAVEQVAQVIQTNSATAEESASASEELSAQSETLKQMVSNFKLKEVKDSRLDYLGLSPDLIEEIERIIENKKRLPQCDGNERALIKKLSKDHEKTDADDLPDFFLTDSEFGKY